MFVNEEKQSLCNSAVMLKIANQDLGNQKLNVIVTVQNSNPVFVSSSKQLPNSKDMLLKEKVCLHKNDLTKHNISFYFLFI